MSLTCRGGPRCHCPPVHLTPYCAGQGNPPSSPQRGAGAGWGGHHPSLSLSVFSLPPQSPSLSLLPSPLVVSLSPLASCLLISLFLSILLTSTSPSLSLYLFDVTASFSLSRWRHHLFLSVSVMSPSLFLCLADIAFWSLPSLSLCLANIAKGRGPDGMALRGWPCPGGAG